VIIALGRNFDPAFAMVLISLARRSGRSDCMVEGQGMRISESWRRFTQAEGGATAIEYSLIAAFVGLAIIAGTRAIGTSLSDIFPRVANNLS
jgi:pilus assembly protein Flp/PilA